MGGGDAHLPLMSLQPEGQREDASEKRDRCLVGKVCKNLSILLV